MRRKRPTKTAKQREVPRCYGIKAAADLIGVPPSTLKTWISRGYIARIKAPGLRGRVLIREDDLLSFLDLHREPAVAEIHEELRRMESAPRRPPRPGKDG